MASDPIVVVGASLAANRFVRAVRRAGWDGGLIVIGDEAHAPYDRPPLSKQFLAGDLDADDVGLTSRAADVDWRLGVRATRLLLDERRVVCDDGTEVVAGHVVIATGARARHLPGTAGMAGVHVLRTLDDAIALRAAFDGAARVAIVGAGFIGCEVAATARGRGLDVTMVDPLPAPVVRGLGPELGGVIADLHVGHGVDVRCGTGVAEVVENGDTTTLITDTGERIDADVVVVGIGAIPTTDWLDDSGLTIANGVVCDDHLAARGGGGRVWAMGDVCRWGVGGDTQRLEHWTNADDQAKAVARNLLGASGAGPFTTTPYVWSDQYDVKVQMLGEAAPDDDVHVLDGDLRAGTGLAAFTRDGRLTGVVGFNEPRLTMSFRAPLEAGASLDDAVAHLSAFSA